MASKLLFLLFAHIGRLVYAFDIILMGCLLPYESDCIQTPECALDIYLNGHIVLEWLTLFSAIPFLPAFSVQPLSLIFREKQRDFYENEHFVDD